MNDAPKIGGLDMAVNSTGYCAPDGSMHTISPNAGARDHGRRLAEISAGLRRAIRLNPPIPTLVLIERYNLPFPSRKNASPGQQARPAVSTAFTLGEVGGVQKLVLAELGIPFVILISSSIKKFATGNGKADKALMIHCATSRILEVDPAGIPPRNSDEADAFHLRRFGRVAAGVEMSRCDYELEAIEACGVAF